MIPKSILGILTSISFLRFWHIFLLPFIIWIGDKCLIFILYVILELTFYFTGKYDYARLYKLSLVATEEQLSDFRKWQWWRARFYSGTKNIENFRDIVRTTINGKTNFLLSGFYFGKKKLRNSTDRQFLSLP